MVIHSLTNNVYTYWGMRYSEINWDDRWSTYTRIQNRQIAESFITKKYSVKSIISWFDQEILQKIGKEKFAITTLNVRIRIVCGMVNKNVELTRDQKLELLECIWDTYRKFTEKWNDYYCLNILGLPF